MENTLGDAPIEMLMKSLAQYIDRFFNGPVPKKERGTGFILLTFDFGDSGKARCNYISNVRRKDAVVLLREQLRQFEGAPDVEGHA